MSLEKRVGKLEAAGGDLPWLYVREFDGVITRYDNEQVISAAELDALKAEHNVIRVVFVDNWRGPAEGRAEG